MSQSHCVQDHTKRDEYRSDYPSMAEHIAGLMTVQQELRSTEAISRKSHKDFPNRRRLLSTESVHLSQSQVVRVPVNEPPHPSLQGIRGTIKRIIDLVGAGFGLLMLSPLFLVIALLIKLDSPGPIIFKQKRVGLNHREFWMYKFRSMVIDAEDQLKSLEALNEIEGGVTFKIKHDPRVTRIGRLLRKTSLDELPQLINVLRSEMSLVGPRPPLPKEVALYTPEQRRRLSVMPGCTGLWQISGRSTTTFKRMVELDLEYIDQWSLRRDLLILFKTICVVLKMEGSY